MRKKRVLAKAAWAILLVLAASGAARAAVTVKGKVEYWDQLRGGYFPCRFAHVEVEGDWFWLIDPDVLTDQAGFYTASLPDPPFWWDNYDGVDIEVYAETNDILQVFSSMWSWWPYHAISAEKDDVRGGQVVLLNMRIGGPSNTAAEAYYRTMAETANAFALHDRALEEHRTLRSFGWPASDFDETEVLVPAASPTGISYYNHATGFVNIAVSSAGLSGLGSWEILSPGNDAYCAVEDFRDLVQHEYGHGIHDEITGPVSPLGLSMPMYHSPKEETNRYVAFTEGLATFLPLAVNNDTSNHFEASRLVPGGSAVAPIPATGDHWAMEGEVTAVLWDVFDGVGAEPFRHPAVRTADNSRPVPQTIIDAQRWTDRIQDAKLLKFRKVITTYVPAWPVMTIGEFLDVYRKAFPAELHALKSIAFNRDISLNMPVERPAALVGTPKISRFASRLTASLELSEPDPEDRPFVRVFVWLEKGAAVTSLHQTADQKGWTSGNRAVTFGFNLPPGAGPGDGLWFVVSDDMLPQAYRAGVPADKAMVELAVRKEPDLSRLAVRGDVLPIDSGKVVVKVPGRNLQARAALPDAASGRSLREFREAFSRARAELRSYAESAKTALRRERGLRKLGRTVGDLTSSDPEKALFRLRPRPDAPGEAYKVPRGSRGVVEFEQWKGRVLGGRGLRAGLTEAQAADLARGLSRRQDPSLAARAAAREITALRTRLRDSAAGVLRGEQEADLAAETAKAVSGLDAALARAAADTAVPALLKAQETLIRKISGGRTASSETQVRPGQTPMGQTAREAREDALRLRVPDISGRWQSNILSVYDISQDGAGFTWRKLGSTEVGRGTVDGTSISASWTGGRAASSTTGTIEVDAEGRARRIVWKNGVVFFRNPRRPAEDLRPARSRS